MNLEEHIEYWINGSNEDLKVAKSLFDSEHFLWSLFIGHLVIEKSLKALFVKYKKSATVPRTHNLLHLAELCSLDLDKNQKELFFKVNDFNIEARYPDIKSRLNEIADKEFAEYYLNKIEENVLWIKSKLK